MRREPELEIVYDSNDDDLTRSAAALIRYVTALTPQTRLSLRQWQQLAQVYRAIEMYVERRTHDTEHYHGLSV